MKPSTFYTNGPALIGLDERSHRAGKTQWPTELEARLEKTKSLATSAPMLVELWRHEIREWTKRSPRIRGLTAKDKPEVALWQAHFDAGHLPFTRGCARCAFKQLGETVLARECHVQTPSLARRGSTSWWRQVLLEDDEGSEEILEAGEDSLEQFLHWPRTTGWRLQR